MYSRSTTSPCCRLSAVATAAAAAAAGHSALLAQAVLEQLLAQAAVMGSQMASVA